MAAIIHRMRTQSRRDALGIGARRPRFSWSVDSNGQPLALHGYRIQASREPRFDRGEQLWDSADVACADPWALYGGQPLDSRDRFWWRVQALTGEGRTPWSAPLSAELGLLHARDWSAQWITHPEWADATPPLRCPVVTTRFAVAASVARARLYVGGLGVYVAELDGQPVDATVLDPGVSEFTRRVGVKTIDLTSRLGPGVHTLSIRLGEGPAHVRGVPQVYSKFAGIRGPVAAIAQLELTDRGGSLSRIVTDSAWDASLGGTTFSHWYGGESFDAGRPPTPLVGAAVMFPAAAGPRLWCMNGPGMTVHNERAPLSRAEAGPGRTVIDFGTNIAGRPVLTCGPSTEPGTTITLWPAERVDDTGWIDQTTTGSPVKDSYTSAGGAAGWHPEFCYHGFRYLGIEGAPEDARVSADVVRTDDEPAGEFGTDHPVLERLWQLIHTAVESNLYSVPTDCPHREKLGWLEQLHLVFGPVAHLFDVHAHFTDVIRTILDSQAPDGLIPDIVPELVEFTGGFRSDVNWGSTVLHLPWLLYRAYGDPRPMAQAWQAGRDYLRFLDDAAGERGLQGGLGDWIALDESTPRALVAGYGHARALSVASTIARALGDHTAARSLQAAARDRAGALLGRFAADPQRWGSGSQASWALLLDLDAQLQHALLDRNQRRDAADRLDAMVAADGHVTVGEIALPALLRALAARGRDDLVLESVVQTRHPGYGQMIEDGLTSLAESWRHRTTPLSANHFMLGAIGDWLIERVAGLTQPAEAIGWRRARFSPSLLHPIGAANARHQTPFGSTGIRWHRSDDGTTVVHLSVPPGMRADFTLKHAPGYRIDEVTGPRGSAAFPDPTRIDLDNGEWRIRCSTAEGR